MWGLILRLLSRLGPLLVGPVSQFVTGINIGQVLGAVSSILWAIVNNFRKYWRFYLPVALASLQLLTAYGWNKDHIALKTERVSHQADIRAYKQAQADAQSKADTEKQRLKQESEAKADAANKNYSTLYAQYRANLLRYQASQRTSGRSGSGELAPAAQSVDGPGESSSVPASLTITMNDAQICADNTARLMAAHDWALSLDK